ncbi:GNAT family N-acetyltransferase [Brevibacillus daliensis]|uniref:GNAT family N-acetyltransferase n=1 Tax=Brevibacillus daliensis TaxID=2892995 RepID=UPI001E42E523|nr:GNAT family N-acetyltransferase [Brevibacillus daliensis]
MYSYQHPGDFLRRVGLYLEQNEVENNLILGLLEDYLEREKAGKRQVTPFLATVEEKNQPLVVIVERRTGYLVVTGDSDCPNEAIQLAMTRLDMSSYTLKKLSGKPEIVDRMAIDWEKRNKILKKSKTNQIIYKLEQVVADANQSGYLRQAKESDSKLVSEWVKDFFQETGQDVPIEQVMEGVRRGISENNFFLWEEDGKIVSMAKKVRETKNGGVISLVYTPRTLRENGFATSCVTAVSKELLAQGFTFCCLYADEENTAANTMYENIGYKSVQKSITYTFA